MTPLEAATHADPYAYYTRLREANPLQFDAQTGLWIASSAHTVEAILAHPDCHVRPVHEPVPAAIAQGATGRVFAQLMRMNEGAKHQCPRAAIEPALASFTTREVAAAVAQVDAPIDDLNTFMFTLPVSVVALLLGAPREQLQAMATLTRDFVACLSPLSSEAQRRDADVGATRLSALLSRIVPSRIAPFDGMTANLIGLLSQTCEASAGLIGNTLVTLQRHPDLLRQVLHMPQRVTALVAEVVRYDCPVQNTRRFVARRCTVAGRTLDAGDTVLVLLAAANRDPAANPEPDRLQLDRPQRRTFSFGAGRHQCLGQHLALTIATHAIERLLHSLPSPCPFSYWPSLNGRIPRFHPTQEHAQ